MIFLELITSRSNPLIVDTAKLKDKKYRDEKREFLFEGIKLTREAINSKVAITRIFLTEKCAAKYPDLAKDSRAVLISDSVCTKISENNAPEGIICRANYITDLHGEYDEKEDISKFRPRLFLWTVQDPGNLGTIARTSAAFGRMVLILTDDCADIYNQKTVRASMGAMFRIRTRRAKNALETIEDMKKKGYTVYATALTDKAITLQEAKEAVEGRVDKSCFVLGNEGHGLSDEVIESCSQTVIIPMEKDAESLNVAAAATVILWEGYR